MRKLLIASVALVLLVVLPGVVIKRGPSTDIVTMLIQLFTDYTALANGEVLVWDSTANQIVGGGDPPLSGAGDPRGSVTAASVGQVYINTTTGLRWYATATGTDNWVNSSWQQVFGGTDDASVTTGHCYIPWSWAAAGTNCANNQTSLGMWVPVGTTMVVTDVSLLATEAVNAATEECNVAIATGDIGSGIHTDTSRIAYTNASVAAVNAGIGISAAGDSVSRVLKDTTDGVLTVAGGDWMAITVKELVAADCTDLNEPVACCGGSGDVGSCAGNCTDMEGVAWTLTYLQYLD